MHSTLSLEDVHQRWTQLTTLQNKRHIPFPVFSLQHIRYRIQHIHKNTTSTNSMKKTECLQKELQNELGYTKKLKKLYCQLQEQWTRQPSKRKRQRTQRRTKKRTRHSSESSSDTSGDSDSSWSSKSRD
ncbi:hypothetical protein [Betatorquevirus homini19]|uniref:DUF755 domain-containing protein n=1 Tax=TTV-like mini virus TaxID=93678 RepID=M4NPD1_9VIRU|nr:hypothetical protein QKL01_gp3 [TTV-like mini virus]AGG91490.1 hypothetical protein [TTV-like mini virus]